MALSARELVESLTNRFDLGFEQFQENLDGEIFLIIRPVDVPRPNGFGISIARTPKWVEASLRMDRFSRGLLKRMGESDAEARSNFALLSQIGRDAGVRITASINGTPVTDFENLSNDEWTALEVDCDTRLPLGPVNHAVLHEHAFKVLDTCIGLVLSLLPLEESAEQTEDEGEGLPEGAKTTVVVNRYERNRVNRARCISHYGAKCVVCGFDFEVTYGPIGREVIEVHHITPVSEMGENYRVNPITDLVPVCSNCHTILHRRNPPFTIKELQKLISGGDS